MLCLQITMRRVVSIYMLILLTYDNFAESVFDQYVSINLIEMTR